MVRKCIPAWAIILICGAAPASADLEVLWVRSPKKLAKGECASPDMAAQKDRTGEFYNVQEYYKGTKRKRITWERGLQEMELTDSADTLTTRCLVKERICTRIDRKKVVELFGKLMSKGALKGKEKPSNPPFAPTGESRSIMGFPAEEHQQALPQSQRRFYSAKAPLLKPIAEFWARESKSILGTGEAGKSALALIPALRDELTLGRHFLSRGAIVMKAVQSEACPDWRVTETLVLARELKLPEASYELPDGYQQVSTTDYTNRMKEIKGQVREKPQSEPPNPHQPAPSKKP